MKRTPAMTAAGVKAVLARTDKAGNKSIKVDAEGVVNDIIDAALATVPDTTAKRGFRYVESRDHEGYHRVLDFNEECIASCVDQAWAERIVFALNHCNKRS